MQSLTLSYLTVLRDALRDDFPRAMHTFGLENHRFAGRIEVMDQAQLNRLAGAMTTNFLRFNETLALEMLVEGVIDNAADEELRMCTMAHALTTSSQPSA